MKNKKIKMIAFIVLISLILHFVLAITHINYNCIHKDNCSICLLIHKFKDNLNGINPNFDKEVTNILLILPLVVFYPNNIIRDKKDTLLQV